MASINLNEQKTEAEIAKLKAEKLKLEIESKNQRAFSFRYILQAVVAGLILAFTIHNWILPVFNTETKLMNMKSEINSIINEKEKFKLIEEKNMVIDELKKLEKEHMSDLVELDKLRNQIAEINNAVAVSTVLNPEIKENVEKTSQIIDKTINYKTRELDRTKKIIRLKEKDLTDFRRREIIPNQVLQHGN